MAFFACCVTHNLLFLQSGLGKLVVMGSAHIFSDQYLDKEENSKLQEVVFRWLTSNDISLNSIDADDPEVMCTMWDGYRYHADDPEVMCCVMGIDISYPQQKYCHIPILESLANLITFTFLSESDYIPRT